MNIYRKTATMAGVLFLISYVAVFAGSGLLGSILEAPDYLTTAYPNKPLVKIGVFLELINGLAVVGIAVTMFPLLKKYSEALALGYVGMRILECAMQIAADNSPLALLKLSQEFVKAGTPDATYFQTIGTLLLAERQSAGLMLGIFFGVGAVLFYYILYQSKLVPRFISVWGLIAAVLVSAATLLEIGGVVGAVLVLPIILNELFIAIWLIVKGFNLSAIASVSAKTATNELLAVQLR
jgi:hypothetical protein